MKREHHSHHLPPPPPPPTNNAATSSSTKAAMWEDDSMDELLAVLGYKVKSSSMAHMVEKIEQLDKLMDAAQEDGCSHLASDTVHYNPSDLSNWLESMISEIPPNFDPAAACVRV